MMKTSKKQHALVIGSGVAGLAVSIRLAAMGYSVEVWESNEFPGGKLSEIKLGPFRFDAGPSLFTMPHLVEELYWISGQTSKSFPYRKLEEVCRYFFPDGTRFQASADQEVLIRTLSTVLGEESEKVKNYLERSHFKYHTIGKLFLENCLRRPSTFFNRRAFRAYFNLFRLGLFNTLDAYNQKFFKSPAAIQLFNRYATYNGSDPYQTPAVMSMIPHLEFGIGAFFPEGGMIRITQSLYELALQQGVRFHFNRKAEQILLAGNKAVAVRSGQEIQEAELVVSAIDVSQTYRFLLRQPERAERYLKLPKSTSAIIWYWGIHRKSPETGLHNLFFSSDYEAEFKSLFQKKEMPSEPTIYLNISSKEEPGDAPAEGENWFVMVNAPANEGQDWDSWIPASRKAVISRLSRELGFDVASSIEQESFLDPRSLEARTGSIGGALYGSNSNGPFAAFLRHANFSSRISNLYFCGGTVHPGGGIPLALQSASLVESWIRKRARK